MNSKTLVRLHRSHLLLLGLIVAFAAVLRFYSLSTLGYWTDEFCTLCCSDGWGLQFDQVPTNCIVPRRPIMTRLADARSALQIMSAMARDEAHPPLYFLLLRGWEDLLGDSESAVRSLNVLFCLLAIVLLFFAARDSIGDIPALWACLLMAVADPQIQFSQEARNYMPVVTFSLAAILSIQRIKRRATAGAAVMLGGSVLAMMLTHYFAAGVAAAIGLYAIGALHGRGRKLALSAIGVAAGLFCIAWGPLLIRQLPHFRSNYAWVSDVGPDRLAHLAVHLAWVPWRLIAEMPRANGLQFGAEILGVFFFAALPWLMLRRPELRLWVLWMVMSVGLIAGVDLIRCTAQLGLVRYTLFAAPAMYVLIAGCIRRGRARFAPVAVAVMIALLSLPAAYVPAWKIDFRTPVQLIARQLGPGDGLVILGSDLIPDGVMYGAFEHYLPRMPAASVLLTRAPAGATLGRLRTCPHVWVVRVWPVSAIALPGFKAEDRQTVPYFAEIVVGRFER